MFLVQPKSFVRTNTQTNGNSGKNDMVVIRLDKPAKSFASSALQPTTPSANDLFAQYPYFV